MVRPNISCWNNHQNRFYVAAIVVGTVVATRIVGTAVPTKVVGTWNNYETNVCSNNHC